MCHLHYCLFVAAVLVLASLPSGDSARQIRPYFLRSSLKNLTTTSDSINFEGSGSVTPFRVARGRSHPKAPLWTGDGEPNLNNTKRRISLRLQPFNSTTKQLKWKRRRKSYFTTFAPAAAPSLMTDGDIIAASTADATDVTMTAPTRRFRSPYRRPPPRPLFLFTPRLSTSLESSSSPSSVPTSILTQPSQSSSVITLTPMIPSPTPSSASSSLPSSSLSQSPPPPPPPSSSSSSSSPSHSLTSSSSLLPSSYSLPLLFSPSSPSPSSSPLTSPASSSSFLTSPPSPFPSLSSPSLSSPSLSSPSLSSPSLSSPSLSSPSLSSPSLSSPSLSSPSLSSPSLSLPSLSSPSLSSSAPALPSPTDTSVSPGLLQSLNLKETDSPDDVSYPTASFNAFNIDNVDNAVTVYLTADNSTLQTAIITIPMANISVSPTANITMTANTAMTNTTFVTAPSDAATPTASRATPTTNADSTTTSSSTKTADTTTTVADTYTANAFTALTTSTASTSTLPGRNYKDKEFANQPGGDEKVNDLDTMAGGDGNDYNDEKLGQYESPHQQSSVSINSNSYFTTANNNSINNSSTQTAPNQTYFIPKTTTNASTPPSDLRTALVVTSEIISSASRPSTVTSNSSSTSYPAIVSTATTSNSTASTTTDGDDYSYFRDFKPFSIPDEYLSHFPPPPVFNIPPPPPFITDDCEATYTWQLVRKPLKKFDPSSNPAMPSSTPAPTLSSTLVAASSSPPLSSSFAPLSSSASFSSSSSSSLSSTSSSSSSTSSSPHSPQMTSRSSPEEIITLTTPDLHSTIGQRMNETESDTPKNSKVPRHATKNHKSQNKTAIPGKTPEKRNGSRNQSRSEKFPNRPNGPASNDSVLLIIKNKTVKPKLKRKQTTTPNYPDGNYQETETDLNFKQPKGPDVTIFNSENKSFLATGSLTSITKVTDKWSHITTYPYIHHRHHDLNSHHHHDPHLSGIPGPPGPRGPPGVHGMPGVVLFSNDAAMQAVKWEGLLAYRTDIKTLFLRDNMSWRALKLAVCGDGVLDPGEQCDDGNTNPHDDCTGCRWSICGDNVTNYKREECDGKDVALKRCSDFFPLTIGYPTCTDECKLSFINCRDDRQPPLV